MPQTPEQDCIYIKKRVGFVKLAIQTGIDIMPIYHLGQSEVSVTSRSCALDVPWTCTAHV